MSLLSRIAFVLTFAWSLGMGGFVPGVIAWMVYGPVAGVIAGLIGGVLGFLVHRFAWAE